MRETLFALEMDIVEKADEQCRVWGFAMVAVRKDGRAVLDSQGDMIDLEDLEETAYEHVLEFREGGEMHVGQSSSRLIESMVFTPEKVRKLGIPEGSVHYGWWVGYQLTPEVYKRVKSGDRLMFSIQGTARREPVAPLD